MRVWYIYLYCYDRDSYISSVSPLEFDLDDGPAIEELLGAYPSPVTVSELSHSSEELDDKLGIAQSLYKEGFLFIMDDTTRSGRQLRTNSGNNQNQNTSDDEDDNDIF